MKEHNMIKVVDNFLEEEYFKQLQSVLMSDGDFPWYYNDGVVNDEDKDPNNYQFTHTFYDGFSPRSEYYNMIVPIIEILEPTALMRIKANLLTKTERHVEHGFHIDILNIKEENKSKTAILYINTNNGYTVFEDGALIDSIENRIAIFDSRLMHTGSTCTDEKVRVVINFNYF